MFSKGQKIHITFEEFEMSSGSYQLPNPARKSGEFEFVYSNDAYICVRVKATDGSYNCFLYPWKSILVIGWSDPESSKQIKEVKPAPTTTGEV